MNQQPQDAPGQHTAQPELDPVKLQMFLQKVRDEQNLGMAVVGGAAAAVFGAIVWAAITYLTGYQIGFMAIGIGFLVGLAVRKLGNGIDQPFGIAGAVLSLFGCVAGNLLTVCIEISRQHQVPLFDVISRLTPATAWEWMVEMSGPMDILFYGLAVYYGYRYSFRPFSETELAALRRR